MFTQFYKCFQIVGNKSMNSCIVGIENIHGGVYFSVAFGKYQTSRCATHAHAHTYTHPHIFSNSKVVHVPD